MPCVKLGLLCQLQPVLDDIKPASHSTMESLFLASGPAIQFRDAHQTAQNGGKHPNPFTLAFIMTRGQREAFMLYHLCGRGIQGLVPSIYPKRPASTFWHHGALLIATS